ncbi:MAG: EamA family transporter [Burkholderiales bacterium]|nr:EamA family transporter [Burkholderiales bacterium]
MPIHSILLTLFCVLLIAVGQLLFKAAAAQWKIDGWSWATIAGFLSPVMLVALAVYGFATLLWVYVLRTVPLSVAYALFSLAFLIVPLLAYFVLGERIGANTLIGGAIIVVGVVVAVR